MESGYLSRQAVKDLLAVQEGETIYLRNRVDDLEKLTELLHKQIENLQSRLGVEQHYWKSL